MRFLVQNSVFDKAGEMIKSIIFAAIDIRENQSKAENLRAFGAYGEMHPILHSEPQQMQSFITLLCETADKGRAGQMRYNTNTRTNYVICTHDNYKATLTDRNEKQQLLFAPSYVYEPLERHTDFADLCGYLTKAIQENDAKVIILDNCAHYLQSTDYWEIKTTLEQIAHNLGCCIFAGFCVQDTESTYFEAHRQNVIYLASDIIHGQPLTKYIYNNGACMGIFAIDTDGKINVSKWAEQYLLRELLPCVASEPATPKELEQFFFGVFAGDKTRQTIACMLKGARDRGETIPANTRNIKYVINTGEHPTAETAPQTASAPTDGERTTHREPQHLPSAHATTGTHSEPQRARRAPGIALTAFSDMQKTGIRKRIPILKYGEYRQFYCCVADCLPHAPYIIMGAILKGDYLNIKASSRKRKKILFCTHDNWECENIELNLQKHGIRKITDFAKCHVTDIKHNLASIEEQIKEHTPDFVIISTGDFEGKRAQKEIPAIDLQRLAQTYNVAIIVHYEYMGERENLQELDRRDKFGEYWTQIAPTGNASIIRGSYKGIPFKHIAMYSEQFGKLWVPHKDEFLRAVLEETFSAYTGRIIANKIPTKTNGIKDIITGEPITIKNILKAEEMGIIKLYKQPITANKHRYVAYVAEYIPPTQRPK